MSDTLTAEQIADRWGCDPSTIRRMRLQGRLPAPVPSPLQRNAKWREADIMLWEQSLNTIVETEAQLNAVLAESTDHTAKSVATTARRIVCDPTVFAPLRAAVGHLLGKMNLHRAGEWTEHDRNRARKVLIQLSLLAGEIAGEKEGEAILNAND